MFESDAQFREVKLGDTHWITKGIRDCTERRNMHVLQEPSASFTFRPAPFTRKRENRHARTSRSDRRGSAV